MQRFYFLPFIVGLFCSCSGGRTNKDKVSELDTVYADIHHLTNRETYLEKLPIISISNDSMNIADFKIGRTDTVLLTIKNFNTYETEIRNETNVLTQYLGTNKYLITPTDSNFRFEIWQNYDSGKVILTRFDQNQEASHSNYNGWRIVGIPKLKAE